MNSIWRRLCTLLGVGLIGVSFVVPVVAAGAEVGPAAASTTVVPYSCAGVGFAQGLGTLPTQNVTLTLGAPTFVTPGQEFVVTLDMTPLQLADAGFPISAPALTALAPVGGTGSSSGQAVSPNVSFAGSVATVPRSTMTVVPTVGAGGSVTFTAGQIRIVIGATGFACVPIAGSAAATVSTAVMSATTTTSTTLAPTTTTPGQTTTSTVPETTTTTTPVTVPPPTTAPETTTTTSTSTTVAPVTTTSTPTVPPPTTPTGPAVSVVSSASASFTCNIYDDTGTKFNQNPLPASAVTVVMTLPDKVGVGGAVSGLVRLDPGPLNGPIRLPAGTVTFAATMQIAGGSPATIETTGGPNGAEIAANTASVSPNMAFSFASTAAAGTNVGVGVSQVEVRASSPSKLTTRCTPSGTAMGQVGAVAVVTGTVAPPADITAQVASAGSTSGSSSGGSAANGFANCAEAKAAGRGTILRSDPAYKASLDADGDGLACERGEVLGTSLALTGSSPWTPFMWSALLILGGALLLLVGRSVSPRRVALAVAGRSSTRR